MKAIQCTNCGANIDVPKYATTIKCDYCKTTYSTTEFKKNIKNSDTTINSYQTMKYMKFCKNCGNKILKNEIICPICETQVEDVIHYTNKKKKKKFISLILCIMLGPFGAHKFYEGKILLGILYLLTFGLLGVGIFVDFCFIICKPDEYYV